MRARLAIHVSGIEIELREILLRDKPSAFIKASPTKTVPCLISNGDIIDESLDIMKWALQQSDPENWLQMPDEGWTWIEQSDGPFKSALDRTKYDTRYPGVDPIEQRDLASEFLKDLNGSINEWIFERPTIADFAILPFVRQFAFIDKTWFDEQPWPNLQAWLERFLQSQRFKKIMHKYPPWREGERPLIYGAEHIASSAQ